MAQYIAEGLWRLDIPLAGSPLKNLNSYLLTGGGRSLLIDTGFRTPACLAAMERELAETGVDREALDIFLTHLHSDHAGLAPQLLRGDGRILISGRDADGLAACQTEDYWRRMYASYAENGFPENELEELWYTNSAKTEGPRDWDGSCLRLADGDALRYGGAELRCVLTPGHTPGHMCLFDAENRRLFSGDHVLFHITPNICRWTTMPDALGSYLESLGRVRELDVSLLLPAHRSETGDLRARVDELRAHHARRLDATLRAVTEHPGLTACAVAGLTPWRIRSRSWAEFPPMQRFFAVGETLAHLDYLALRGRVRSERAGERIVYFPTADAAPLTGISFSERTDSSQSVGILK